MNVVVDKAFDELKQSYIESSLDRLNAIELLVTRLIDAPDCIEAEFPELSGQIHSLKGSAGVYGFMSVTVISHQLEDYLATSSPLNGEVLENIKLYLDQIYRIFDAGNNPGGSELEKLLRGLPVAQVQNSNSAVASKTRVLLVMEKGVLREMASLPITKAGFRLSSVDNVFYAIELIATTQPDIVISSMEFSALNGSELARAVAAMRSTAKIPFVLLTSHSSEAIASEELPPGVHVIKKSDGHTAELVSYLKNISARSVAAGAA